MCCPDAYEALSIFEMMRQKRFELLGITEVLEKTKVGLWLTVVIWKLFTLSDDHGQNFDKSSRMTDRMFRAPNCLDSRWRAFVSVSDWTPIFVVKVPDLGTTHLTVATNDFSLWVTSLIFIVRNWMRAVSYCYLFDFVRSSLVIFLRKIVNLTERNLHTLLHTNNKSLI